MDAHPDFFKHSALDHPLRQIRLLRLHPGDEDSDICCELETHTFDKSHWYQALQYQAISYVWGDPNNLRSITVDSKRLVVRFNCWDALRQVRAYVNCPEALCQARTYAHMDEADTILVWIDAVCINQNDLIEKSAQVQMMGDIFERASDVFICPGPPDDSTTFLMQQADKFLEVRKKYDIDPTSFGEPAQAFDATLEWIDPLGEEGCTRLVRAIYSFGSRPYWTRAWIVQELRRAREKLVLCGHKPILFRDVMRLIDKFTDITSGDSRDNFGISEIKPYLKCVVENAELEYDALFELPVNRSLGGAARLPGGSMIELDYAILNRIQDLQCSDSRDRIFALTKVLVWNEDTGPPVTNYTRDALEVAVDALMRVDTGSITLEIGGFNLIDSMLRVLDISRRSLKERFGHGVTPGSLRAIMWRSEDSIPGVRTCVACKTDEPTYKLKIAIKDWAVIELSETGRMMVQFVKMKNGRSDTTARFPDDGTVIDTTPGIDTQRGACTFAARTGITVGLPKGINHDTASRDAIRDQKGESCNDAQPANSAGGHVTAPQRSKTLAEQKTSPQDNYEKVVIPLRYSNGDNDDIDLTKFGLVNSSTRNGDLLVRVLGTWYTEELKSRHIVLRHVGNNVYKIIGHAFLPEAIELLMPIAERTQRPSESYKYNTRASFYLSMDIEDGLAHVVANSECLTLDDQIQRQFCLREMSSFGRLFDPGSTAAHDFCLKCGEDLGGTQQKS